MVVLVDVAWGDRGRERARSLRELPRFDNSQNVKMKLRTDRGAVSELPPSPYGSVRVSRGEDGGSSRDGFAVPAVPGLPPAGGWDREKDKAFNKPACLFKARGACLLLKSASL